MCKDYFGNAFDFNNDGSMDDFEKRAEFTTFAQEVALQEGITKDLSDMSSAELSDIASKTGINPSEFGF